MDLRRAGVRGRPPESVAFPFLGGAVYSQRMKKLMILLIVAAMATAACSSSTPAPDPATSAAPASDGGGGSSDALSLVLGSADQTDEVGSYKMQFTMTMSGMGDLWPPVAATCRAVRVTPSTS